MTGSAATSPADTSPRDNAILASLPEDEYVLLAEELEVLGLGWRELLYEVDAVIEYVYFPLDGLASLLMKVDANTQMEVGAIGREGMLGVPVFLGAESSSVAAYCQVAGRMVRLPAKTLQEALPQAPILRSRLGLFSNTLVTQLGQNAACNRAHNAEQRCARWLLLAADRINRDRFDITHEFLSHMIGVRRATVSETAQALAEAGVIDYRRGTLTILDRPGLAERACPCYEQARDQIRQLFE